MKNESKQKLGVAQLDFHLEPEDREQLTYVVKAITTPENLRIRAQVLLLADEGKSTAQICRELDVADSVIPRWISRYQNRTPEDHLIDLIRTKGRGGKRLIPDDARAWVRKIAGPEEQRGTIKEIQEKVRAQAIDAGYPRLANVSFCAVRQILLEDDD